MNQGAEGCCCTGAVIDYFDMMVESAEIESDLES